MSNKLLLIIIVIVIGIGIGIGYKKYFIKENLTNVATEIDDQRANKYALKKICEENGYLWQQYGNEFAYDCIHTKKTCLKESVYPTPKTPNAIPRYYEWRDKNDSDFKKIAKLEAENKSDTNITDRDGICILGVETYRKWCEDELLRYDSTNGHCYTNRPYCQKKLLGFCNNDCFEPPAGMVLSKIFGNTLGKSLGATVDAPVIAAC